MVLFAALTAAFLVVFNASTYILYRRARSYLEATLGERLKSIAVTAARALEERGSEFLASSGADRAFGYLQQVAAENLLSNAVLLDAQGRTLIDLSNLSEPGSTSPLLDLDYSAVSLARAGFAASTRLYRSGEEYLKSAYAPIHDEQGEVAGILGVEAGAGFFDVLGELRRAIVLVDASSLVVILLVGVLFYRQSRSLDRAMETLLRSENLSSMGRMVAGIAHEIRNPLGIIKTAAERLVSKYGDQEETLTYISEEVDRLDRILTGYLTFARAERRPHEPLRPTRIVERALRILEPELTERRITVTRDFGDAEVEILGDPNRVQQALLNLLLNASQAVEEGGHIKVTVSPRGDSVVIAVADDGCGMDAKALREATKPFFTTKSGGSGLGLAIVADIMEEHRGALEIKSRPGGGTTVTLTFPRKKAELRRPTEEG